MPRPFSEGYEPQCAQEELTHSGWLLDTDHERRVDHGPDPVPATLRPSLTWSRGKDPLAHVLFTEATKISGYFADAKIPWHRDGNEHVIMPANSKPSTALNPAQQTVEPTV